MNIKLSEEIILTNIKCEDHQKFHALISEIYKESYTYLWKTDCNWYLNYAYGKNAFNKDISERNSINWFVVAGGEKVGVIRIVIDKPYPDSNAKKAVWLHRIYLKKEVHGTGLGKLIMDYVVKVAQDNRCEILWLDCMDSKDQALKYYAKHGFNRGRLQRLDFENLKDKYRGIFLMWKKIERESISL